MSEQPNDKTYGHVTEDIKQKLPQLKKAFSKHSGGKKVISLVELPDLLEEYGNIIQFDTSAAIFFFTKDNQQIPEDIDLDNLTYENVMFLLDRWMKTEVFGIPDENNIEQAGGENQNPELGLDNQQQQQQEREEKEEEEGAEPRNEEGEEQQEEESKLERVKSGKQLEGDNSTENLMRNFSEFCRSRNLPDEEIPVELWQDYINALENEGENSSKNVLVANYLKSILDNTFEDEPNQRINEVLRNIANSNKITLTDLIALYQLIPDSMGDSQKLKNKAVLDDVLASNETFLQDMMEQYGAQGDGDERVFSDRDQLAGLIKEFYGTIVRLVDSRDSSNVPLNPEKKSSLLDELMERYDSVYEENPTTQFPFAYADVINLLYFIAENVDGISLVLASKLSGGDHSENFARVSHGGREENERDTRFAREDGKYNDPVVELKAEIRRTIQTYEERLNKCKTNDERKIVLNMISSLQNQLDEMDKPHGSHQHNPQHQQLRGDTSNSIAESNVPGKSKAKRAASPLGHFGREERRDKGLMEIFQFYGTEQMMLGKHSTFDHIKVARELWNVGKMFIFMKDFQLFNKTLNRSKALEIFKKIAPNSKEIEFKGFKGCLDRFASAYYHDSEQYETEDQKRDAFYGLIGVDEPGKYKEKLTGVRVAFNTREKEDFRVQKENGKYHFKLKPNGGKTVEEIKEDIKRRGEQRNREKFEKVQEKLTLQLAKKNLLEKAKAKNLAQGSYAGIQKVAKIVAAEEKGKVTWEKLENLTYAELQGIDRDFKPTDLIDDNDDEDQLYLAEYDLNEDKIKRNQLVNNDAGPKPTMKSPERGSVAKNPTSAVPMRKGNQNDILRDIEDDYYQWQDSPSGSLQKDISPPKLMGSKGYAQRHALRSNKSLERQVEAQDERFYGVDVRASNGAKISNQILARASEIDNEQKKKDQQRMKNIMEIQDQQMKKGMKYANKSSNPKKF